MQRMKPASILRRYSHRFGLIGFPLLALGGCVSDTIFRSFLVGQLEGSIIDVFSLAADQFVRTVLFPGPAG